MTQDNAALKPPAIPSASRGIHLVDSRSRRENPLGRPMMIERTQTPQVPHVRESHAMATLSLAVAALSAPLIWIGHAILHWMHVL